MGQRSDSTGAGKGNGRDASLKLCVFPTALGWFGLWGAGNRVSGLTIGHDSAEGVRDWVRRKGNHAANPGIDEADWFPELRRRLTRYAEGIVVEFDDVEVESFEPTPFQDRVLKRLRGVPYGGTMTYGELAREVEAPGAARAVGSVMASNRVPIIVPCHRVVAAGGRLGGFSAPQGVSLKRRLLELEAAGAAETPQEPSRVQNARQILPEIRESLALVNS